MKGKSEGTKHFMKKCLSPWDAARALIAPSALRATNLLYVLGEATLEPGISDLDRFISSYTKKQLGRIPRFYGRIATWKRTLREDHLRLPATQDFLELEGVFEVC